MKNLQIKPISSLKGEICVPGDKSISHRAVMLGSIAEGRTVIANFLMGEDCLATIDCFRNMGVAIEVKGDSGEVIVESRGLHGLEKPNKPLYVGNSGTTIRLLSGILAGQDFDCEISGDASIQKRPMKRIIEPLTLMGAKISGSKDYPPLKIKGSKLKGIEYKLPIASAQVKSCLLLAGLYAEGKTVVIEPSPSRDHTERMLKYFGGPPLQGREISVPGDISSAAFFMVAGLIVPNSDLLIRNVGLNPTRTGIIEVIHRMGGKLEVQDEQLICYEPRGNIRVKGQGSRVKGIEIGGALIPRLIDEIPIIAVLATQAEGTTIIKDAKELRVKESDRIATVSQELRKMGANIQETDDGMIIKGPTKLKGAKVQSYGDHRVAMSLAIAGLVADSKTTIENTDCIATSFPGFEALLLGGGCWLTYKSN